MKTTLCAAVGGALIAALVGSMFGHESAVFAQRPSVYDPTGELIALPRRLIMGDSKLP